MLANYSVPLGSSSAEIIIRGQELTADDFAALGEYVQLFKRQFERTQSKTESEQPLKINQAGE